MSRINTFRDVLTGTLLILISAISVESLTSSSTLSALLIVIKIVLFITGLDFFVRAYNYEK